ncbi:hypothetical protein WMY93_017075 [Mugilogobius chulae]|uniref:Coiled-coil domain containing 88C n=1 Tax=Mugilogobius chulae TaxID=88201 RepID=A0AAW0NNC0_9GOBI
MDVTLSEMLATFMESPLVVWVRTLGPLTSGEESASEDRVSMFMELVDGVFLHKIMTQIDPSPTHQRLSKNVNNDVALRLHNLTVLVRHIRTYYQCERKEEMIEKIKLLDIETQAAIVSHIQEVTHNQLNVLDLSWLEGESELVQEELEPMSRNMATSLRQLIDQRDKATEVIVDLTQERDYLSSQQPQQHCRDLGMSSPDRGPNSKDTALKNGPASANSSGLTKEEKHHLSVELADTKAKLRRYRQELEEKTEQLMDSKHEAERLDQELQRIKQEHQSLSCEARSARVYRDEVDSLREKASRVDRLEAELTRCKEKLNDVHFYKTRVEELRDDNLTLMETKVLLEEQLSASRGRCDKLHTLEKDNLLLRAKINDLEMERENERRRLEELVEENMLLEIGQKQSMNESAHLGWELEQLPRTTTTTTLRLNECVSSRVLKLEKENRELQASIERLKEDNHSLEEKQLHAQELDRENQTGALQGLLDQEKMTNQDMESLGEEILKEKQALEREMHILKADKDRQILELESEKKHLSDAMAALQERAQANSEARVREVETENRQLHQNITESSSKLVTMETQLKLANEEVKRVRDKASRCEEVEREARGWRGAETHSTESERSETLEKQVSSLEQEIHRLKREAEESQKELQRLGKHESEHGLLSKENLELRCSVENLRSTTARLTSLQEEHQEVQKVTQELRRKLEEAQDVAQTEKKRAERLEVNMAALNHEKHRLEENLERHKEEKEEIERENQEVKSREEELRRELQELKRKKLQKDFDQSEKSRKHLEKESWRMRTLLETKEAELEERSRRLTTVQKEGVALKKEMDRLKELSVKAKEELVSEKLNFQQQNVELERLNEDRYRLLESRLEETVQQSMKLKEEKISSGELDPVLSERLLMAQNAVLQGQVTALETEVESWQRQREEAWRGRESVLSDHERLLNVHERQAHEYEALISQHAALKTKLRAQENEHRTLHNKYCVLLQQKDKWEKQEGQGQKEKEELGQEVQKNRLLQQENLQLKNEVDRLTVSQSHQSDQCEGLQQRLLELKSSLSAAQTEAGQWMSRYDSLMEQHQGLDLTMTKLDNHCELLSRLKGNLEEENHHLLSQINLLSQQNHTLLERSMESKELYHQEQKLYIDKLNALRRQKEKLEEKIMDQYKFYDPSPKKAKRASRPSWTQSSSSNTPGGSNESVNGEDALGQGAAYRALSSTPTTSSVGLRAKTRPRTQTCRVCCTMKTRATPPQTPCLVSTAAQEVAGVGGLQPQHVQLQLSVNCRGTGFSLSLHFNEGHPSTAGPGVVDFYPSDRQGRSASLSSDDVICVSQSQQSLSRSSTLPYDHAPQKAQPQRGAPRPKTRPASPGSEMVTLEQFLHESNLQSPPVVSTGSREDLMTDYFTRSPAHTAPSGREQTTPQLRHAHCPVVQSETGPER